MSIANQITRINTAKADIKEVVNQDFEKIQDETITYYPEKIAETIEEYKKYIPEKSYSGTEINVDDAAPIKGKIAVKGNTYQKQLSGKNFFDVSDVIDVTDGITVDEDGWITVSFNNTGSSNKFFNFYTKVSNLLQTSRAYSIITEIKNVSGNGTLYSVTNTTNMSQSSENVSYNFTSLSNNNKYKNIFTTVSDFTNATTMIRTVLRFSAGQNGSITFRLSVLEDTEMSVDSFEYEPYCGGQASPNPDYPQPIKVVTGNNVINHVGKNRIKVSAVNTSHGGLSNTLNNDNSVSISGTSTQATSNTTVTKNQIIPAGTYIFSINKTVPFNVRLRLFFEDDTNNDYIIDKGNTSITFNSLLSAKSWRIWISGLSVGQEYNETLFFQLEEGSVATEYEPYREESFEVNLGKNLFDKDNANIINAGISAKVISTSEYNRVLYIPVKSNTTYTIQRRNDGDVNRFRVGSCTVIPANTVSVSNSIENDNATNITITTGVNDKYLAVMYYRTYETVLTEQQILDSIQIEEGSTATSYSKYFTPIELCKIGDYEDVLFKNVVGDENYNAELESGAWYKKKVFDKEILDNNTVINSVAQSTGNPDYTYVYSNILDNKVKLNANTLFMCDCFRTHTGKMIKSTQVNTDSINISNSDNNMLLRFMILTSRLTEQTNAAVKVFFNSIKPVLYYELREPVYEKITDTTLISQLEALNKFKWFKGVNHIWTETENLEPVLEGKYKAVVESEVS